MGTPDAHPCNAWQYGIIETKEKIKMPENKDQQPIVRIDAGNGRAYYPRFIKNTKGEWELNDKSFLIMLKPHMVLEKPAPKTDKLLIPSAC